mgnify:CR=1 FL=1
MRAVHAPWYVVALAVFAVGVLPGGIPLTTLLVPFYVRHRLRLLERPQARTARITAAA